MYLPGLEHFMKSITYPDDAMVPCITSPAYPLLHLSSDVYGTVSEAGQPGHRDAAVQPRDIRQGQVPVDQVCHQVFVWCVRQPGQPDDCIPCWGKWTTGLYLSHGILGEVIVIFKA